MKWACPFHKTLPRSSLQMYFPLVINLSHLAKVLITLIGSKLKGYFIAPLIIFRSRDGHYKGSLQKKHS